MKYTFHFVDGKSITYESDQSFLSFLWTTIQEDGYIILYSTLSREHELVNGKHIIRIEKERSDLAPKEKE